MLCWEPVKEREAEQENGEGLGVWGTCGCVCGTELRRLGAELG